MIVSIYLLCAFIQAVASVRWFDRGVEAHDRMGGVGVFLYTLFAPALTLFLIGYMIYHITNFLLTAGRNDR